MRRWPITIAVLAMCAGCGKSESTKTKPKPKVADPATQVSDAGRASDAGAPTTKAAKAKQTLLKIGKELAALGLDFDVARINSRVVGVAEAERFLDKQQDQLFGPNHFATFFAVAKALGLPAGADPKHLRRETVAALTKTFAGMYDPAGDAMLLLDTDMAKLANKEALLGHELVHAFQDQKWDINSKLTTTKSLEQLKTLQCVIEGHAELVSSAMVLKRHGKDLSSVDIKLLENSLGKMTATAAVMAHYQLGYAHWLRRYRAGKLKLATTAWPAVPPSTEQIIHPEKLGKDVPTPLTLPHWPASLGSATLLEENTYGELMLYILLLQITANGEASYLASTGWDGDRLRVYRQSDGSRALMWRILFDRPKDARQFVAMLKNSPVSAAPRGRVVDLAHAQATATKMALLETMKRHPANFPVEAGDAATAEAAERSWANAVGSRPFFTKTEWIHPSVGVRVPVLPGWSKQNFQGQAVLGKQLLGIFTHVVSVVAMPDPTVNNLDDLIKQTRALLTKLPKVTLRSINKIDLAGTPGIIAQVEGRPPQAVADQVLTTVTFKRGSQWVHVVISISKDHWKTSEKEVSSLVSGLRVDKSP